MAWADFWHRTGDRGDTRKSRIKPVGRSVIRGILGKIARVLSVGVYNIDLKVSIPIGAKGDPCLLGRLRFKGYQKHNAAQYHHAAQCDIQMHEFLFERYRVRSPGSQ